MKKLWITALLLPLLASAAACGGERTGGETTDAETMAAEHAQDAPQPTEAATTPPAQDATALEVVYGEVDGKPVRGTLARPKGAEGPLPGLIVIHEWWGLNDNIRQMTQRLAGEGYTALAVDLYGRLQTADQPDRAMQLMKSVVENPGPAEANLRAAYQYLETQEKAPKIGVIGWCFGGGWSLHTALLLPDRIDATVIYYGQREAGKEELRLLGMPVIGFFGGQDRAIPPDKVRAFEKAMKEVGKDVQVYIYNDADHAFANPSGGNYNATAASDAWAKTTAFLANHLKK